MSRLARKKEQSKKQILEAAKKLFGQQGFKATTTRQIAEAADVGDGTIYNYFKNKADIYVQLLMTSLADEHVRWRSSDVDFTSMSLVDCLDDVLQTFVSQMTLLDKETMKEFFSVFLQSALSKDNVMSKFLQADVNYLQELEQILCLYKDHNRLDDDFDVANGAELAYSVLVFEIVKYIGLDTYAIETLRSNMTLKLHMIFDHFPHTDQ